MRPFFLICAIFLCVYLFFRTFASTRTALVLTWAVVLPLFFTWAPGHTVIWWLLGGAS